MKRKVSNRELLRFELHKYAKEVKDENTTYRASAELSMYVILAYDVESRRTQIFKNMPKVFG